MTSQNAHVHVRIAVLMEDLLLEIHVVVNLNVINVHVVHNHETRAGPNVHVNVRIHVYLKNLVFQIPAAANLTQISKVADNVL